MTRAAGSVRTLMQDRQLNISDSAFGRRASHPWHIIVAGFILPGADGVYGVHVVCDGGWISRVVYVAVIARGCSSSSLERDRGRPFTCDL